MKRYRLNEYQNDSSEKVWNTDITKGLQNLVREVKENFLEDFMCCARVQLNEDRGNISVREKASASIDLVQYGKRKIGGKCGNKMLTIFSELLFVS